MVLRTCLVYNTVVWLCHFFCCGGKVNFVRIPCSHDRFSKISRTFFVKKIIPYKAYVREDQLFCFGGSVDFAGTAPHSFPADYFGGSSDLAGTTTKKPTQPHNCTGSDLVGTCSTAFYRRIVLEVAQIWRELAPHYFPVDCFGGA